MAACAHAPVAPPPPPVVVVSAHLDDTPRIAIATAFEPEIEAMAPFLQAEQKYQVNGVTFYTGKLAGHPVVLFMTGVSMVNASMNTQLLIDKFNITDLVMSGIAGGVDPAMKIGDVAIPEKWGQYNEAIYLRERDGKIVWPQYTRAQDAVAPPFLFISPEGVRIASAADPRPQRRFWFEVDPGMLAAARLASDKVKFQRCTPKGDCLSHDPKALVGGAGVTGSVFMDNAKFREYLFTNFGARVVEMETAATAMVAYANNVRFIAFRSLSDLAGGGNAPQNEEETFGTLASSNAAAFTIAFLEAYHPVEATK
ncbi:MAG: 5'-methylthioadenosine/S-adenosylhomocysteine nucleosidase [Alphaproteobacteria bacterium]